MSKPQPPQPIEWSERQRVAYGEAGNMLRHYSSSRTAVLSITVPVCLAALGWALSSTNSGSVVPYLLAGEALLFSYAVTLSLFFSMKYEQTRRLLMRLEAGDHVNVYTSIASSRPRDALRLDGIDKSLAILGVLLHVAYYAYYFSR